jgi:hypothetical protein
MKASLLLLLILLSTGYAQPSIDQFLVYETEPTNCDNFRALIDRWMGEVNQTERSTGYVIVQGPEQDLLTRLLYEGWVYGQLEFRLGKEWDRKKFLVIEGPNSSDVRVQFWRTTSDVPARLLNQKKWDLSLALISR